MWLFKKKKEVPVVKKADYSKYKIKITMRVLCYYEQLTKKTAFNIGEEDALYLLYSSLIINNPQLKISFDGFILLCENDERFAKWLLKEYMNISKVTEQINDNEEEINDIQDKSDTKMITTVTEVVSQLIITYGINPFYVMDEMQLWELKPYMDAYGEKRRMELEDTRFWTYLTILPHIDAKKVKGPHDIVPFTWEKTDKEKAQENIEKMQQSILATLAIMNKPEEEKVEDNEW